jgi:hypothetical protein
MTHNHDWIDITGFGDTMQRLFCNCAAAARRTFTPINISTTEDEDAHRTRIVYNDGSGRVALVPKPMQIVPLLFLELEPEQV